MNNLSSKSRNLIVAGIAKLWAVDQSNVRDIPTSYLGSTIIESLKYPVTLNNISIEKSNSNYNQTPDLSEAGNIFNLEVNVTLLLLSAEKENQLMDMSKKRLLIVFKDNLDQYRIMNACRMTYKALIGEFIGGKPVYELSFKVKSICPAFYFKGTVFIGTDSVMVLS